MKKDFDSLTKIAEDAKDFLKPIDFQVFKNTSLKKSHVEILYESYESNLMEIIERADAVKVLNIAKETLNAIIKANEFQSRIKAIPENILLKNNKIKLIDFNLSNNVSVYAPPEVQKNKKLFSFNKVGIYYWGMTMYQLMTKKSLDELKEEAKEYKLFEDDYNKFLKEVQGIVLANDPCKKVSSTMISILLEVLRWDASMRPSYKKIQSSLGKPSGVSAHIPSNARSSDIISEVDSKAEYREVKSDSQTTLSKCRNNNAIKRELGKQKGIPYNKKIDLRDIVKENEALKNENKQLKEKYKELENNVKDLENNVKELMQKNKQLEELYGISYN
jgi:hypothetical protein